MNRLVGRYGKRLGTHYFEYVEGSADKLIALETMIAIDTEQVETLEDLMRGDRNWNIHRIMALDTSPL